jgi:hypothetical protein
VQEIGVLLRSVIEYNTQVEYILLSRDEKGNVIGKAAEFLSNYLKI